MKLFILLSTFIITSITQAQTNRILFLDSLTHNPVADVEIQTERGSLFSDNNGEIELDLLTGNHIIFAHPNYVTKYVVFSEKLDTILLTRKPHQLMEVSVKPNAKDEFFELGYYHAKSHYKINYILNTTCTVAVFIQASSEKAYIDEILLRMKPRQYAKKYSIYLYKPDKLGMPGKIIYKRTITVDSLKKEGVINIHELFIKVPKNGLFVGLGNHQPYNYDDGIMFYGVENSELNVAYIMQNKKELNPYGAWVPLRSNLGGVDIPRFGLRVYQKQQN